MSQPTNNVSMPTIETYSAPQAMSTTENKETIGKNSAEELAKEDDSSFFSMLRLNGGGCCKGFFAGLCCCCVADAVC
ncbi:hypothetical protein PHYBLDRAFT_180993 [Phycomyces blakesleeanus NRRL 1555(-)]|uniref:Cysteine-rich transmembrane CYSTM domain-containing protein n=1 Tax=Phycomyces blakesleeanus (strain ATCC 8743b / DSM 1359 / FGSC 10004 / NBRC 33097 / NRRL 1555) TaxID=763407 RepID=A0A162NK15_PHYB8|nr:hypothetical protein PHYBLDRAFT_180993 [Phycomyces blakesleeanus NRRL 1555(-)]OAD74948.1 hypothetical protein PHYBLDRAFT_180993 [Phycomyces blakesleeanus NRRL 1555(-)]|eukprot:XP_018292988.1 hypothetical protein PHYBLDRAFT_180993 [Phycomyces blakesleeanus NRRL 1555(-)]